VGGRGKKRDRVERRKKSGRKKIGWSCSQLGLARAFTSGSRFWRGVASAVKAGGRILEWEWVREAREWATQASKVLDRYFLATAHLSAASEVRGKGDNACQRPAVAGQKSRKRN
jgi:hypothetical protein